MIKKIAWNTFKNTGDINTFLEYKQIEIIENQIEKIYKNNKSYNIGSDNGINKNQNNTNIK